MAAKTLIQNGLVYDGTGSKPTESDVLIENGKIAAIAPRGTIKAGNAKKINAKGMWVTPGFLDTHTHYDAELAMAAASVVIHQLGTTGTATVAVTSTDTDAQTATGPLDTSDSDDTSSVNGASWAPSQRASPRATPATAPPICFSTPGPSTPTPPDSMRCRRVCRW